MVVEEKGHEGRVGQAPETWTRRARYSFTLRGTPHLVLQLRPYPVLAKNIKI